MQLPRWQAWMQDVQLSEAASPLLLLLPRQSMAAAWCSSAQHLQLGSDRSPNAAVALAAAVWRLVCG